MKHREAESRSRGARVRPLRILASVLLVVVLLVLFSLAFYRPDRPVPVIEPGSSSGPSFVVQVIRPRMGLPLGGILPPQIFGLDPILVCDTQSPGATVGRFTKERLEVRADGWDVIIALDGEGRVTSETRIVVELEFEERRRTLRCRPAEPPVGSFHTRALATPGEFSGHFDIELGRCEDAVTGERLGWPPRPLRLYGSFDRLRRDKR